MLDESGAYSSIKAATVSYQGIYPPGTMIIEVLGSVNGKGAI